MTSSNVEVPEAGRQNYLKEGDQGDRPSDAVTAPKDLTSPQSKVIMSWEVMMLPAVPT